MGQREVQGVLGHEVTHIANGDMVTMTLVQGVVNAFVMFLSRVLAFALSQTMRSRDDDRGGGSYFMQSLLIMLFQVVFGILGSTVVCWFSRWREFRADAGGARLAGRGNMIDALRALRRLHDPEAAQAEAQHSQGFQSLKISGASHGLLALFATHPPLEARIARLEAGNLLSSGAGPPVAKRLECAEVAPALGRPRQPESASKLDALHTLRDLFRS